MEETSQLEAFVYFIKEKNASWTPLSQWHGTGETPQGKVKSNIILKIEENYILLTTPLNFFIKSDKNCLLKLKR